LFDDDPEDPKPYWCVDKSNEGGTHAFYTVVWDNERRQDKSDFDNNLSAALAVLARQRGGK
jgi:hypothetical protein